MSHWYKSLVTVFHNFSHLCILLHGGHCIILAVNSKCFYCTCTKNVDAWWWILKHHSPWFSNDKSISVAKSILIVKTAKLARMNMGRPQYQLAEMILHGNYWRGGDPGCPSHKIPPTWISKTGRVATDHCTHQRSPRQIGVGHARLRAVPYITRPWSHKKL